MNVLLVTLDQFRGDCLSAAGHPIVRTPHLDRLAAEGVLFARHYSQSAPCSPGRASLYTGMYQSNHRVVVNGTPLDARFETIASVARRAGYRPTLFGYTDQSVDPREATGPDDPRLQSYEGILPGLETGVFLTASRPTAWIDWLRKLGHEVPDDPDAALSTEPDRPAGHSMAAFLTDRFLDWLGQQQAPWFAHLSHFRPHPPYAAAGHFASLYDPAAVPPPVPPEPERHPHHVMLMRKPIMRMPASETELRHVRAQYYGMVSEVDHQLGRVWEALERAGQWDETLVLVTADHGEQLGDHGLLQKGGWFDASYHVPGIVRDPRKATGFGRRVDRFTENVDFLPTIAQAIGADVPAQCDGRPLTSFLDRKDPADWRDAAHFEYDWRAGLIRRGITDRNAIEAVSLAVRLSHDAVYVHFSDGDWLCYDLAADPTGRTRVHDPALVLPHAQAMLTWRARHLDRTMTGMLVEKGGIGHLPPMAVQPDAINHPAINHFNP